MLTLTKDQTETTLNNHIYAFSQGDVDALMADYAEEAIFFTPEGVLHGKNEIRQLFEQLLAVFPPGSEVDITQQLIEGETAYVVWNGESQQVTIPLPRIHCSFKRARL